MRKKIKEEEYKKEISEFLTRAIAFPHNATSFNNSVKLF